MSLSGLRSRLGALVIGARTLDSTGRPESARRRSSGLVVPDSCPALLVECDAEGRIAALSGRTALLERSPDSLVGVPFADLFDPADTVPDLWPDLEEAADDVPTLECRLRDAAGGFRVVMAQPAVLTDGHDIPRRAGRAARHRATTTSSCEE